MSNYDNEQIAERIFELQGEDIRDVAFYNSSGSQIECFSFEEIESIVRERGELKNAVSFGAATIEEEKP